MPTQAKEIFEAQSRSLRELLSDNGLGLYLPPYQRPYGWSRDKVIKLLDDTLHGLANLVDAPDTFTFLGTVITVHDVNHVTVQPIVKAEVPSKVLTIIDGQQRISTLLLLLVNLHNLIRQRSWKVFKGAEPNQDDGPRRSMYAETVSTLNDLGHAIYERKNFGDAPIYPRLIRAFVDQWSKDSSVKRYESPIAFKVYEYAVRADAEAASDRPTDFKPKSRDGVGEGEVDLNRRFNEIRNYLENLAKQKENEVFEPLPSLSALASKTELQRALFNHELDPRLCALLQELEDEPEAELMRLVMLAAYALNRIALTVVQGKDEDYAFTIFESLNTTGEPLTAIETFLPRVVMAERLDRYQNSKAHGYMKVVQSYLNRFDVGEKLQSASSDLLVTFALAETGKKESKRLPDQRAYMSKTFETHKDSDYERSAYLRHLSDTASFLDAAWSPITGSPKFTGLDDDAMTDTVKLCLGFLAALNHTIAIAPIVRFYSVARAAVDADDLSARVRDLEKAVKAVTAFTVFWRSTRRGTGNIDREYRAIMGGDSLTGIGPLARSWGSKAGPAVPQVDAEALKREFVARLIDSKHGGVPNLASFIASASSLPIYSMSRPLTRFLLLAAYHDTTEDDENPGLVKRGRANVSPCFTSKAWCDEDHLTVEHVAPRQSSPAWDARFYGDKEMVHRLGNLVLAPGSANSSLGARPWSEKRVLYRALGAHSSAEARAILDQSDLSFSQSTEQLASLSRYLPHLRALGAREADWDSDFVATRTDSLLTLVYLQLKDWLGLEWSEAADGPVSLPSDDGADDNLEAGEEDDLSPGLAG